jgi:hypothetical protein
MTMAPIGRVTRPAPKVASDSMRLPSEYTQWQVPYQNYVYQVTRVGDGTWTYTGVPGSPTGTTCSTATFTSTNPVVTGKTVTLQNCPWYQGPDGVPPAGYDPFEQLTNEQGIESIGPGPLILKVVMPEGNQTLYSWDARGNLKTETQEPKPGSSLPNIVLSANYSTSCSNALTCNEPNFTTDGNLNTTNYTYNQSNGELATQTDPAVAVPSVGNENPETVYTYTQQYAWVLNSSGNTLVQAATPIWLPSTETTCRTTQMTPSGCSGGAADQVTTTYYYGPNSGSVPNNLYLRGVSVAWNGTTRVTCYGYDKYGNRISVTKPNAGLALTSCDQFTVN